MHKRKLLTSLILVSSASWLPASESLRKASEKSRTQFVAVAPPTSPPAKPTPSDKKTAPADSSKKVTTPKKPTKRVPAFPLKQITFKEPVGKAQRTKAAVSRSGAEPIKLVALTPESYGMTVSQQPSVFWYQSDKSPARGVKFSLYEDGAHKAIFSGRLPVPYQKGINRLDLKNLRVTLTPGKTYRWSVTYINSARSGSANAVTKAMLKVSAPSAALKTKLAATDGGDRIAALAEAGAWQDLLAELDDAGKSENAAVAKSAKAERSRLLAELGVDAL